MKIEFDTKKQFDYFVSSVCIADFVEVKEECENGANKKECEKCIKSKILCEIKGVES